MSKIIGVIPARYGSSRFPGKPLANILGRPMIEWVYRRAKRCRLLSDIIVATDDQRIKDVVEGFGGQALLTSEHHPTGTDRLTEVAKKMPADYYLNIQGDEPLVQNEMLELLINPLLKSDVLMSTLGIAVQGEEAADPNIVKVVVDLNGYALYFSRAPIPFPYSQKTSSFLYHMGFYGFQRDFLLDYPYLTKGPLELKENLEQLRALENGYRIKVAFSRYRTIGVDRPEDIPLVSQKLKEEELI